MKPAKQQTQERQEDQTLNRNVDTQAKSPREHALTFQIQRAKFGREGFKLLMNQRFERSKIKNKFLAVALFSCARRIEEKAKN